MDLKEKLLKFKDKAFCYYTHEQASTLWREISKLIPEPFCTKISIEWGHVGSGHGYKQACSALNDEIRKFLNTI